MSTLPEQPFRRRASDGACVAHRDAVMTCQEGEPMSSLFRRRAVVVPFVVLLLLAGTLPALAATVTRTSTASITIAETGAASPYPSTIDVGGLYGGISDINVTLAGLSHEFPTDIT